MKFMLLALMGLLIHVSCLGAVILQYHHVSATTPKNTSVTPAQFEVHLNYLKEHNFNVVPLPQIINKIKKQQTIKDKTVAITFDDAYIDILKHATPLLEQFNYPYTIFVNPGAINQNYSANLSWQQLKKLAAKGVTIANHGFNHNSIIRVPKQLTQAQWLTKETNLLLKAEAIIKEKTGQNWRYYAYPYGEFDLKIQQWLKNNNFIAFSQQSGAVGINTDLSSIPRFPASMPFDKITSLQDKLNSLAFNIQLQGEEAKTIVPYQQTSQLTLTVELGDFNKSDFNCYISGLGKQKITWNTNNRVTINFSGHLPVGRVRCNCTAASISKPGRYYWYSKPWFVLTPEANWYPL